MKVLVQLEYKADKKEPFGSLVRRIAAAFQNAGLEAVIAAAFGDSPVPGGVSAVERVLRKYPALAPYDRQAPILTGTPNIRWLMNDAPSEPFPFDSLLLLADGLPRSFPFHTVNVMFKHEQFGDLGSPGGPLGRLPGVVAADRWWVNGRVRSLGALYVVDGDSRAKTLPSPPAPVAGILSSLGKAKKSFQYLLPAADSEITNAQPHPPAGVRNNPPEALKAGSIVSRYRAGMPALLARLALPYELPPFQEAIRESVAASGPLKPALVEAFAPRGYSCHFESGTFTLRRRTPDHHVVDLVVDVGTWSHLVTVMFAVHGPGFKAVLPLPISKGIMGQYPIGDAERWRRIVANLAMIVAELDRTFLPELEQAVGRAPEWFEPGH